MCRTISSSGGEISSKGRVSYELSAGDLDRHVDASEPFNADSVHLLAGISKRLWRSPGVTVELNKDRQGAATRA
jgi:hypothetical protein